MAQGGVTVLKGRGEVLSDKQLVAKTTEGAVWVNCDKMILTTGAAPLLPNIKGIGLDGVITSNDTLSLDVLPESIVIIGAGAIGLEFATMLSSMGVKVTVIELQDKILPGEDSEVAAELLKIMKRQGISFKLSASVTEIQKTEDGLSVAYIIGDKVSVQTCEKVLVAVGRKLNAEAFQNIPLQMEKRCNCCKREHGNKYQRGLCCWGYCRGQVACASCFYGGKSRR